MSLLSVNNLGVETNGQWLVSDLSFEIEAGARMGLIGESGSGKSITAMTVMGLLPAEIRASGSIILDGQQVVGAPERRLHQLRGASVAAIFQEPLTALDPLMKLGRQIAEPLIRRFRREGREQDERAITKEVQDLLERVSLGENKRIATAYPYEVSGGQRQRVAIAMALACKPKLLIADEPTTALDVTTQAEILKLLDDLVRETGMTLLFISHDLPVVARVVEEVSVLRAGQVVEQGAVSDVLGTPKEAYTKELVEASRAFERALDGTS